MIAVITGATRGIGRSLCFAFAEEGFDLSLTARSEEGLKELQLELKKLYPGLKIIIQKSDFSNKEEIKAFAAETLKNWEAIDVLINNVGIFTMGTVSEETDEAFEKHMAVNLNSAWYLTKPFLPSFQLKRKGHIFNICSIVSKEPKAMAASYSVSKMALYGFNKVLCEEMRQYNVKVTAVLPGSVNTSSWERTNAPLNTFVQPKDIASTIMTAYKTSEFALTEEIIIKPLDKNY